MQERGFSLLNLLTAVSTMNNNNNQYNECLSRSEGPIKVKAKNVKNLVNTCIRDNLPSLLEHLFSSSSFFLFSSSLFILISNAPSASCSFLRFHKIYGLKILQLSLGDLLPSPTIKPGIFRLRYKFKAMLEATNECVSRLQV